MAENNNGGQQTAEPKSMWQKLEKFQNLAILFSIIVGLKPHPTPGSEEAKRFPPWVLANLDFLTDEDEKLFNEARDSYPDRDKLYSVEGLFREKIGNNGFRVNKYRSRMAGYRQKFLDELRNPAPKNDGADRLAFGKITLQDSCHAFFEQLISADSQGGTPDEIFERQKKIAFERDLLVKNGIFQKMRKHPWLTLTILTCVMINLVCLASWVIRKLIFSIL